jgi:hypothetical protein
VQKQSSVHTWPLGAMKYCEPAPCVDNSKACGLALHTCESSAPLIAKHDDTCTKMTDASRAEDERGEKEVSNNGSGCPVVACMRKLG